MSKSPLSWDERVKEKVDYAIGEHLLYLMIRGEQYGALAFHDRAKEQDKMRLALQKIREIFPNTGEKKLCEFLARCHELHHEATRIIVHEYILAAPQEELESIMLEIALGE